MCLINKCFQVALFPRFLFKGISNLLHDFIFWFKVKKCVGHIVWTMNQSTNIERQLMIPFNCILKFNVFLW